MEISDTRQVAILIMADFTKPDDSFQDEEKAIHKKRLPTRVKLLISVFVKLLWATLAQLLSYVAKMSCLYAVSTADLPRM